MRSFWIWNLTLLISATGCAMPGTQKNALQPPAQQTSWTDKMTAPFAALAPKKKPEAGNSANSKVVDPISLAVDTGPPSPALYVSMAQLSDQGGNSSHARAMYQRALATDQKNLDAMLGLARLEDREGNLQVAVQHYQQAVNTYPEDARPLNDLGLCYARSGQMQASLECLDRAVRLKPDKQLYRNNIAKVLIELNQFDTAVAHLGAVYEPAVANYNMAALLNERDRGDEAIPFLQRALAAKPQMTEATTLLANLTGGPSVEQPASFASDATATRSPIAVSAAIATVNPLVRNAPPAAAPSEPISSSIVANSAPAGSAATASTETFAEAQPVAYSYPTTGAPPMIPVPAQTARVPVGYEPALLPPIR